MKKPIERRDIVINGAHAAWIRTYARDRWLRHSFSEMCFGFILYLAAMFSAIKVEANMDILFYTATGLLIVWYIWYMWRMDRVGNKFWNKVKDNAEPIELQPLPTWSFKFWKKVD